MGVDGREQELTALKDSLEAAGVLAGAVARLNRVLSFEGVCDAVCSMGPELRGIVLGWVGLLDPATREVRPVASWGDRTDYLSTMRVVADDSPLGNGPGGMALRKGEASVIHTVDDPRFRPWRQAALERGIRSVASFPLKGADGTVLGVLTLYADREGWFDTFRMTMLSGYADAVALAIHNARHHESLSRHADELESQVRERTSELEQKNDELQRSNLALAELSRYKSEFLSNMSHELRSPLTAILGFSEVLRDELYGPLNGKQKEHLGHIAQAGRHLLEVIDDVLELSRIESGRTVLDVGECFPRQVIEAAMALLGQLATTQGVKLDSSVDADAEVPLRADARKLKQVIFNLGAHAVKTAGAGGSVTVRASLASDDLMFIIEERSLDGMSVGAPTSGAMRRPGGGLGMNLAYRLVELHGGRVDNRDDGRQSAWIVHLPLRGPAAV